MTLILIFGLALVGVGVDAEADPPGSLDGGAGDTLVLTLSSEGVDGGAMAAASPPGSGFLSPPDGRGFLMGLATMLSPAGEDSL